MTKKLFNTALVTGSILSTSFLVPKTALSAGNGSEACPNPTIKSFESGSESQMTYTDSNNIIENVCIKSGNNMFDGNQHSGPLGNGTYEDGCYEVSGVGTNSVTVKKLKDGKYCQGLSHLDIFTKDQIVEDDVDDDDSEDKEEDKEEKTTVVEKVVEKVIEKRVEVIKEVEVEKNDNNPQEQVLSTNTTQLANTGLGLTSIQKLFSSAVLILTSIPLSRSLKKRLDK